MSGQPAARIGDMIVCPVPQTTPAALPHAPPPGLPIIAVGAPFVLIGGLSAARMGDFSLCVAPLPLPNPIARGAFPVMIMGMPAARLTDQGTHPGSVIAPPCCPTVLIGLAGTSGNPWAANAACLAAPGGRTPAPGSTDSAGNPLAANTAGQSYNNCGIESARQIINQANGTNVTQEGLMAQALAPPPVPGSPPGTPAPPAMTSLPAIGSMQGATVVTAQNQMFFAGGTTPQGRSNLLAVNGIPNTLVGGAGIPTNQDMSLPVAQGRGVIVAIDVAGMPGWPAGQTGAHAVVVTGIQYDDNGNITNVLYNDTGIGVCQQTATAAQFQTGMVLRGLTNIVAGFPPPPFVVTNNQVW